MPTDSPTKPHPDPAGQLAELGERIASVEDEDPDPTMRALELALEKVERALEPFRSHLPEGLYEHLVLDLLGEVAGDPTLAEAFDALVPGSTLQSGVVPKAGVRTSGSDEGARGAG